MSATNFNLKSESTEALNEYYTYYPTWSNTKVNQTTGQQMPASKSFTSMVDELKQETRKYSGLVSQQVEDICISGMSGKFPESENIEEFAQNLYAGVDMVNESERRWPSGLFGLPKRTGTIKDISKFDAQFFGVHPKQVENMDPQLRCLMEVCYESIVDAGVNPTEIKGTRTGVFIGASGSDAMQGLSMQEPETMSGYAMTGCATSMLANRLSYFFDFKGPSCVIDTACSSSLVALDAAITAIKTGQCEQAIVGGVSILARPQTSLQFQKLGMLSQEGMCRSFDASGNGYVRSETVGCIFIQKKSSCKRFYAKVLHSKVNTDGAKEQGITFPSGKMQACLLREIYAECDIDPSLVTYVEAHGTGTKVGDPQELNSIAEVFSGPQCVRNIPLFIGSTKSNMGHSEAASGIAALIKMLISIQRGIIPANLHYQEPNVEVAALQDGRLNVVKSNTKFRGGLMALNSFGFGGANAHILLQPNNDFTLQHLAEQSLWNQDVSEISQMPRLFQFCSRTQQGLEQVFEHMQNNSADLAKQVLLQAQATSTPQTHSYRGWTILNGESKQINQDIQQTTFTGEKRPVCFIFSGMGSQYTGMGQELMKIECFRQSIRKSAETLKPYGLNLIQDIIYAKHNVYERPLNAFVGIAAIQIALVDCLKQSGVEADCIIGHSVGELGCAYADNCMTAEETLLAAYYRGKCIEEAQLPQGAMAAVGLTWAEAQVRCPQGVVAACHNSIDTVTISGPKVAVREFVEQLKLEGVFAKEVDSSNVAFHSYYMTSIAPTLKVALEKVITSPKKRSDKWISTSIPQQRWESELATYGSADYHVNNLCSPVLFQEALRHIPTNAIVVEIAPHALLQSILKRSLPKTVTHIPLMKKDIIGSAQLEHFWSQLGNMYTEGCYNLNTIKLLVPYGLEHTMYPVPVSTGFISHLCKWDHEQTWATPKYEDFMCKKSTMGQDEFNNTFKYTVDVQQCIKDAYLSGHQIDGRVIYPATGYLQLVWQSFARMQGFDELCFEQCPITFENVEIHQATILGAKDTGIQQPIQFSKKITFVVTISPVTGLWECIESGKCVASGKCFQPESLTKTNTAYPTISQFNWSVRGNTPNSMEQEEIYKELSMRGYEYSGEFQPIMKADLEGTRGELMWTGKWIPFLDSMLQMNVLSQKRGLMLPTRIRSLTIDPQTHFSCMEKMIKLEDYSNKYFNKYNKQQQNAQSAYRTLESTFETTPFEQTFSKTPIVHIMPCTYDQYTNMTVCGGVEITGLHATMAPKRQINQSNILERVNFVPYVEKHFAADDYKTTIDQDIKCTCTTITHPESQPCMLCDYVPIASYKNNEKRECLEYYLDECRRYTKHILAKIECPTYSQVIVATPEPKQWTQSIQMPVQQQQFNSELMQQQKSVEFLQGGKLLELLKQCANIESIDGQYFYKVQKIMNEKFNYWKALEEDSVLNYLNKRTTHLKTFLDTVLENTQIQGSGFNQQQKLKVLEISPSMGQFFGAKVNKMIKAHPQLSQMDYQYVPTTFNGEQNMSAIDEILSEYNQQFAGAPMQKCEWNMCIDKQTGLLSSPPSYLKDFDLVIFNGSLSTLLPYCETDFELKQWLNTVVDQCMKPTGFMFVHEFTNNFETLNQLNQLEQRIFRQQSSMCQKFTPSQKYMTEKQWRCIIEDAGFSAVSLKSDTVLSTMFLYRKPASQMLTNSLNEEKIFIDDMETYNWVEQVKQAISQKSINRVWLVSEKQPASGIVGLVNCLRKELGGEKIRSIFIADKQPINLLECCLVPQTQTFNMEKNFKQCSLNNQYSTGSSQQLKQSSVQWTQLFDQLRQADMVMNVFRNGQWGSYRHMFDATNAEQLMTSDMKMQSQPMRNAYCNVLTRGDLSSLQWMQSAEPSLTQSRSQVQCEVSYAALNFRDIMLATGKLTPECIPGYYKMQDGLLGMEFSGWSKQTTTTTGAKPKRVMGMVASKGLATHVSCDSKYLWEVPREWTLKQAATIPVAYSTAYYALVVRGGLKPCESVLIHAGSGAVGQAAISIALSYKCKVFVTVSTDEKRTYLQSIFPKLTDDCFFNSRDCTFEQRIMQITRGQGVNVVLNSLSEDKLQASIRCLSQHGRFLEIGKFDLNKNSQLGMQSFLKNITVHGILVDSLFESDNQEWSKVYQLVEQGIRCGVVRPLNATVFQKHEIESAFRFMSQGKHMGKVLIAISEQPSFGLNGFTTQMNGLTQESTPYQRLQTQESTPYQRFQTQRCVAQSEQLAQLTRAVPKVWFNPMTSYIVTGGLGGFGLELTQWMVERGARHLILTSRSGLKTGYQAKKIRNMQEEFGAQICIAPFDVKEERACAALFEEACKMAPSGKVGGVFHLAAIVDDALFENQSSDKFRTVAEIKFNGAANLDKYSRMEGIMDDSAFFVVFSSVTSGRGNFGQANYGFANSTMERICENRRRDGKHALAIQWGAIADVGMIIEQLGGDNETVVGGTVPQRIFSCLKTLEFLLLKSSVSQPQKYSTLAKDIPSAIWSSFVPAERMYTQQSQITGNQVHKSLIASVANILGLKDLKQWRNEQSLGELGLDSLMNVEVKQLLEQMHNLTLSIKEIQQLTMEKLQMIEQSKYTCEQQQQQKPFGLMSNILGSQQQQQQWTKKVNHLMPTNIIEKLNVIEYMPSKHIPVVCIHPIEGHVNMMKTWAKNMKYPVYGCQFTQECMPLETIEQLAELYWQQIDQELSKFSSQVRVHLVGYSFGASVAFEMAARYPSRIASLTFLDGSHSYVNAHINTYKSKFQLANIHETECEALFTFMQQYTQQYNREQCIAELLSLTTLAERVQWVVRQLMSKSQFRFESSDLELAAHAFVTKLFMSYRYQPTQILRLREILLIKSNQQSNLVLKSLGEDYGLSQVCQGRVQIETVHGDHRSFLDAESGFQVASLMNEFLLRGF